MLSLISCFLKNIKQNFTTLYVCMCCVYVLFNKQHFSTDLFFTRNIQSLNFIALTFILLDVSFVQYSY